MAWSEAARDASLETTLLNHLGTDGFTLKLKSLWQVRCPLQAGDSLEDWVHGRDHQTKIKRKIRFISLGALRQQEQVG